MADSGDISNLTECVEALLSSNLYTVMTAMQHAYTKLVPIPQFIIWVDWDMDQIKLHPQTTKMCMDRLEIGPDGKQQEKDRRLFYLTNGNNNLCLSYATQALRVNSDKYISRYGLEMKEGPFLFTCSIPVRYLLLTYTNDHREWIMNRLMDPVVVMDTEAGECRHGH